MRRLNSLVVLLFSCFFCINTDAHKKNESPLQGMQNLTSELNRIIGTVDSKTTIGIVIKSMKYGDIFYTKNPFYRSFYLKLSQ